MITLKEMQLVYMTAKVISAKLMLENCIGFFNEFFYTQDRGDKETENARKMVRQAFEALEKAGNEMSRLVDRHTMWEEDTDTCHDTVYALHNWAYERQGDGSSDMVKYFSSYDLAKKEFDEKRKEDKKQPQFVETDADEYEYRINNWQYRVWIEVCPVKQCEEEKKND